MSKQKAQPIVYLNGHYVVLQDACISVLDRGFIFGDGVYEVIPAYGRNLFRLSHHLDRLNNSLNAIRLKNPHTPEHWQQAIKQVIEKNSYDDQSVYLQVTRGIAPRDHTFPDQGSPTVLIMTSPLEGQATEIVKHGIKAVTLQDNRWQHCHIKSISLLPNVLLRQEALVKGAQEAILLRDGQATEGSASNLFIILDDCLITPPKGPLLLPGVTRDLVVEIARKQELCLKEQLVSETDLFRAVEIWLTSSTKEILPVTRLNDKIVGNGKPGPYWRQMINIYQAYKQALRSGHYQ